VACNGHDVCRDADLLHRDAHWPFRDVPGHLLERCVGSPLAKRMDLVKADWRSNLHVSAQLNVKVFFPDGRTHWSAVAMSNYAFDEKFYSIVADDFHIILSEEFDCFHIKSQLDPETLVDVKIKRTVPGFKVGKDGKTNYGDDPAYPWGCMKHIFWPQGVAEGTIEVKGEKIDVAGKAIFVMALQGMKPQHAGTSYSFSYPSCAALTVAKLPDGISSLSRARTCRPS
jgi:hypothetical protein